MNDRKEKENETEVEIRPLRSWEEYRGCEEIQRDVWGREFAEVAPADLLKMGQRLGGISSGAFHPVEGLVGFVFGLTGLEEGRAVHWSHMLAVASGHRDRGLGRRLKEHQRELLLERGVATMCWTYDPLVARNAHFNLNKLGAQVVEYVPDMYGRTGSALHEGLGTDRFVVAWDLEAYEPAATTRDVASVPGAWKEDGPTREAASPAASEGDAPSPEDASHGVPLQRTPRADPDAGTDRDEPGPGFPPVARVEIPSEILAVRDADPGEAAKWRRRTREALLPRLESGYRVAAFVPGPERGFYVLVRRDVVGGQEVVGGQDAPRGSGDSLEDAGNGSGGGGDDARREGQDSSGGGA